MKRQKCNIISILVIPSAHCNGSFRHLACYQIFSWSFPVRFPTMCASSIIIAYGLS